MTPHPAHSPLAAEGPGLPAGDLRAADTALLLLTYSRNERYVDPALQNLARFWPEHPPLFVVTDGDLRGGDVLRHPEADFTKLLSLALDDLQARKPDCRFVYLLLEDLAPLGPVDDAYMRAVETAMRTHGGQYVYFLWQPERKSHGAAAQADDLGGAAASLGLRRLHPERDDAFNSLVACLWDLNHLRDVVCRKLALGQTSPWQFEFAIDGDETSHYVTRPVWPTLKHGVLSNGAVSKDVVKDVLYRRAFPPSPLLTAAYDQFYQEGKATERVRRHLSRLSVRLRQTIAPKAVIR